MLGLRLRCKAHLSLGGRLSRAKLYCSSGGPRTLAPLRSVMPQLPDAGQSVLLQQMATRQ